MNRNSAQERSRALLGAAAMDFLASCHVAVFGLGGVGGHAVMALARGGVGELTLVDKDIVEASNLNRQAAAGVSTLGQQKATVMARKALDVAPWALVHPVCIEYNRQTRDTIGLQTFDYILDCVDDRFAKEDLICRAQAQGIPILSCMGTAKRMDPSKVTVMDIYETQGDGLARRMRGALRKAGILRQPVVCSTQSAMQPREGDARTLCSSAFVPAAAGILMAATAVQELIQGKERACGKLAR